MDPITHAVFGIGLAGFSNTLFSPYNPIYAAAITGAVAPDLDVITHLGGRLSFLKHHRGFSHSLPGLILSAALISIIISIDYPGTSLPDSFLWALGGGLSHSLLDSLNIYGTRLCWPWQKKLSSLGLLNLIDPLFFILFLPFVALHYRRPAVGASVFFALVLAYLLFRWLLKLKYARALKGFFRNRPKVVLYPHTCWPFSWNFIVETASVFFLGQLHHPQQIKIQQKLPKHKKNRLVQKTLASAPGRLFSSFTSLFHISLQKEKNRQVVSLQDMRYRQNNNFSYALKVIFREGALKEAYFLDQGQPIPLIKVKKYSGKKYNENASS